MPLAVLWGLIFWHEIPTVHTLVGIVMILSAGLYILSREAARKRPLSTGRGLRLRL